MIFSNSASGWAPLRNSPLIKKPGVPLTPALMPSLHVLLDLGLEFVLGQTRLAEPFGQLLPPDTGGIVTNIELGRLQ